MTAFVQGLIFSFLILSVPLYAANLVVFMAFQGLYERNGIRNAAITGAVVVLAIGLWSFRNYTAFGQFEFSSNSGLNLLLGNSPLTGPNSGTNVNIQSIAPEAANLPELQRDAVRKAHALEWIKGHPMRFGSLFVEKFVNWFNYRNQLSTAGESSRLRDLLMALTYYPLLAMALLLPFLLRGHLSQLESYLYLSYGSAALAYAFFFTRIRFRVPFDFLLIILASAAVSILLRSWRARTARNLTA